MGKDMDLILLMEQLDLIRNLCGIAEVLIQTKHEEFLPTILETLGELTQQILEEHCLV